jgi:hypothetical protein
VFSRSKAYLGLFRWFYPTERTPSQNNATLRSPFVPSYSRIDTRFAWRFREHAELSIVGQNLLSPGHQEFTNTNQLHPTLAQRSVFGQIRWQFHPL